MNPLIISEDFIFQAIKKQDFLQFVHQQNAENNMLLVHCNAPADAEQLIQEALNLAVTGVYSDEHIHAWFDYYASKIKALFKPLKSNSLLLDFQLHASGLKKQLRAVSEVRLASPEEQESILLYNHLANELIVSALFLEAHIPVAFYYLAPQKEAYSEKEKQRMQCDFEVFKSIQSNCVIFLQGRKLGLVA